MKDYRTISKKRQQLIDAKNNSPLEVGERLSVLENALSSYKKEGSTKSCTCTISSLEDGITVFIGIERDRSGRTQYHKINESDIVGRDLWEIGANPFEENSGNIRPVAFTLDSILFNLNIIGEKDDKLYQVDGVYIKNLNWNPFIYDKDGKKQFYQRPFVWTIEDKQLLIESIYQGIDCGKILVRKRDWNEHRELVAKGETDLAWHDIVDGKQRLNAIQSFLNNEFKDLNGNYYSDLSNNSQHKFSNHQLFSYAEMPNNTKDEDVVKQFLKLNFAGVPQSKEHINFVKTLMK